MNEHHRVEGEAPSWKIERYLDCLQHWSGTINLTGAETREAAFATLVRPILGAETLVNGHVIDVGSGNGSPGLILAALRPELRFTLLEPRAKRWAFLREASRQMQSSNVTVLRERSDQYSGPAADTVTIRAVGLLPAALRPLLSPAGGCLLFFGGPPIPSAEPLRLPSGAGVQRLCST